VICPSLLDLQPANQEARTVMKWSRWLAFTLLAVLAIAGVAAVLYGTAAGAHISPDSTSYIGAARSLLAGRGLTVAGRVWGPLTHYPPLFSVLLALGGMVGPDPAVVARWLNALLMGGNILLLGCLLHRGSGGAPWTAALGGLLMLGSPDVVTWHLWALSEPLMIFCGLAGFLGLGLFLENGRRIHLFAASAGMALALLARYAAMPMVAAAALGIFLFRQTRFRTRLWDTLLFLLASGGPLLLWIARNWWVGGNATNRRFAIHWIAARHFTSARATCAVWFRDNTPGLSADRLAAVQTTILYIALGVLLLLVALLIWKTWQSNRDTAQRTLPPRLPWVMLIFSVGYFAFVVLSISFFDETTPLDSRILLPLHTALIVFTLGVLHAACSGSRGLRWVGAGLLLAGIAFAGTHFREMRKTLQTYHASGQGYASPLWKKCRFFERIRAMPEIPIYSSSRQAVYFYTDRLIYAPPAGTNLSNPEFESQLQQMRDDLANKHGVYIRMFPGGWRAESPDEAELIKELGLKRIEKAPEAEVFAILPPEEVRPSQPETPAVPNAP